MEYSIIIFYLYDLRSILQKEIFVFNQNIHVSGVTQESLHSFVLSYTKIGTLYKKLLIFIDLPQRDLTCGTVFRSFIAAIKSYLRFYDRFIIENLESFEKQPSLVTFDTNFKPVTNQFRYFFFQS